MVVAAPVGGASDDSAKKMDQLNKGYARLRSYPDYQRLMGECGIHHHLAISPCPKLTVQALKRALIMFDFDSGWEVGEVWAVTGKTAAEKTCMVQFDRQHGRAADRIKVDLTAKDYDSTTPDGFS